MSKFAQGNGGKIQSEENGLLYIENFLLHKPSGNHKQKSPQTETHNLKKEETEEESMEYHQTKTTARHTNEKIQWMHRATRKQNVKQRQEILIHQ